MADFVCVRISGGIGEQKYEGWSVVSDSSYVYMFEEDSRNHTAFAVEMLIEIMELSQLSITKKNRNSVESFV